MEPPPSGGPTPPHADLPCPQDAWASLRPSSTLPGPSLFRAWRSFTYVWEGLSDHDAGDPQGHRVKPPHFAEGETKAEQLAQSYTAGNCLRWSLNPGLPDSQSGALPHGPHCRSTGADGPTSSRFWNPGTLCHKRDGFAPICRRRMGVRLLSVGSNGAKLMPNNRCRSSRTPAEGGAGKRRNTPGVRHSQCKGPEVEWKEASHVGTYSV
uniref:Uncharacterized protein LOC110193093 n=1 Tax=Phascolarctos cinereus TaxID=38626 RepID=A0A6P5IEA4_PHACI|nr:uncharacterized protein LOC110193093 [Phascolarctos cinereus]